MSIKVHLPSTENHGSHRMPRSLARAAPAAQLGCRALPWERSAQGDTGRRVGGSTQVDRGG